MTIKTESTHAGEFLLSEGNGNISREEVTIKSGEVLAVGAVVGKITSTGKYVAYNDGASTGEQVAAGVLYDAVDATGADAKGVIIARLAEVDASLIVGGDTAGNTDLNNALIFLR